MQTQLDLSKHSCGMPLHAVAVSNLAELLPPTLDCWTQAQLSHSMAVACLRMRLFLSNLAQFSAYASLPYASPTLSKQSGGMTCACGCSEQLSTVL